MQKYILSHTTQFLQQILLRLSSPLSELKFVSVQLLSRLLYQNDEALSLLMRCFPRTLLTKVATQIDVTSSNTWGDEEWQDFFEVASTRNFDSATEQWGEATRSELRVKIAAEIEGFATA